MEAHTGAMEWFKSITEVEERANTEKLSYPVGKCQSFFFFMFTKIELKTIRPYSDDLCWCKFRA